jgi:hypothetical protein
MQKERRERLLGDEMGKGVELVERFEGSGRELRKLFSKAVLKG